MKEKNTFVKIQNKNTLAAFRIHLQDIKKSLRKQTILFAKGYQIPLPLREAPSQKGRHYQIFMLTFRGK